MVNKKILIFAFLISFLIPFSNAVVSHPAEQIIMPGGGNLGELVPEGELICTNVNGLCASAGSQWSDVPGGGIFYSSGNVGIGTDTPDSKLHVQSDNSIEIAKFQGYISDTNSNTFTSVVRLAHDNNDNYGGFIRLFRKAQGQSHDMRIGTKIAGVDSDFITLQEGGKVGIGTTEPSQKLEVSGNIKATKVVLGTQPTGSMDATTKGYVDAKVDAAGGGLPDYQTNSYIYFSTVTTTGNIGGLAGANTFCANNKPSAVPSGLTYKAYMCDSSTCQRLPVAGNAELIMGISALKTTHYRIINLNLAKEPSAAPKSGPYEGYLLSTIYDSSDTKTQSLQGFLDLSTTFWTGALSVSYAQGSTTLYDMNPGSSNCNDWTNGGGGSYGTSGLSSTAFTQTWTSTSSQCSNPKNLLCFAY